MKLSKQAPAVPLETATQAKKYGTSSSSSGDWQGYLQASRLVFHLRRWLPQRRDGPSEPTTQPGEPPRSRPRASRGSSSLRNTTSRTQPRPRSTPAHSIQGAPRKACAERPSPYRTAPARLRSHPLEDGDFHSLRPNLTPQLRNRAACLPVASPGGDSALTGPGEKPGGRGVDQSKGSIKDDLSTISCVESDGDENESNDSEKDDNDGKGNDDSSDSDDEELEPFLEDLRKQLPNPRSLFSLYPEKLDAIDSLEDEREIEEIEFDVMFSNPPLYEYRCPLPDFLHKIDLRRCVRERSNWRDGLTSGNAGKAGGFQMLMDRLIKMEKMQYLTENSEARKNQRALLRRQEKMPLNSSEPGRQAKSAQQRNRRSACLCLQATCTGNCQERQVSSSPYLNCAQPWCSEACPESRERRSRRPLSGQGNRDFGDHVQAVSSSTPSKACCFAAVRRPKTRLISASHVARVRPKSSVFSDTRVTGASGRQRAIRPATAVSTRSSLLKDVDRLELYVHQPVPRNKPSYRRPTSSYGVLSDKTGRFPSKTAAADSRDKKTTTKNSTSLKVLQIFSY